MKRSEPADERVVCIVKSREQELALLLDQIETKQQCSPREVERQCLSYERRFSHGPRREQPVCRKLRAAIDACLPPAPPRAPILQAPVEAYLFMVGALAATP